MDPRLRGGDKGNNKNMEKEKMFAVAFNCLTNFNYQKYQKIIKIFGSLERAYFANKKDLLQTGWTEASLDIFLEKKKSFSFEKMLKKLEKENIQICFIEDQNYPRLLKNIYDPPVMFYYQGNLDINWFSSISIVGSRVFTYYGAKVIKNFMPELIKVKINTISGLAIGIDTLVHQETLKHNGQTMAVLGAGIDRESLYPAQNYRLSRQIIEKNGLILSEFPLKTPGIPYNFPKRNRIIAGLSRYTLVVEAGQKSGSLITARSALDEGREVLTIVGDIYNPSSMGTNKLAKDGAHIINSPYDILNLFNCLPFSNNKIIEKKEYKAENELEEKIIKILQNKKMHIDEICLTLNENISNIIIALSVLEVRGTINDEGEKNYALN